MIKTGIKFFGQNISIESTGIDKVDKALKSLFYDDYRKTAELLISREDAQIALAWSRGELKPETLF
jgi:hypothetical protein